jgi:hypothetical protein
MKRTVITTTILVAVFAMAHVSLVACTCPGLNPSIYPADIAKFKKYYRDEFEGAAFTGSIVSSKKVPGELTNLGDNLLEIVIDVDRTWFGVEGRVVTLYTSDNVCGVRFRVKQSYFFIPALEEGRLYIGHRTAARMRGLCQPYGSDVR